MTLLATLVGLGICAPAVAAAAPVSHCSLFVETGVLTCSTRTAAQPNSADQVSGGSVIIGRVFEDQDFRGASLTIRGPHPCWDGNGRDWNVRLAKYGWANRISSVQAWGNCWLNLYSGPNFNGQHDGPYKTDTPYVGPQLDKRAQSIGFD